MVLLKNFHHKLHPRLTIFCFENIFRLILTLEILPFRKQYREGNSWGGAYLIYLLGLHVSISYIDIICRLNIPSNFSVFFNLLCKRKVFYLEFLRKSFLSFQPVFALWNPLMCNYICLVIF